MTKGILEQYRSIAAELSEVRDRIRSCTVHDTVTGSDSDFPYVQHSFAVGGVVEQTGIGKDMFLLHKLEAQKQEIEDFIDNIPDSELRRIFRYRYTDGTVKPSWQWIAFKIGHYDEQYPRRKHNKFLKMTKMTKNLC